MQSAKTLNSSLAPAFALHSRFQTANITITQIKKESFLEDINALLNSGEVPNMFPYDERTAVHEAVSAGLPVVCVCVCGRGVCAMRRVEGDQETGGAALSHSHSHVRPHTDVHTS